MVDVPALSERAVTGAYILHSGLDKWSGEEPQAVGVHGTAANAFPMLKRIPPKTFLWMLAGRRDRGGISPSPSLRVELSRRRGTHHLLRRLDDDVHTNPSAAKAGQFLALPGRRGQQGLMHAGHRDCPGHTPAGDGLNSRIIRADLTCC
jgi:hypothetical protein